MDKNIYSYLFDKYFTSPAKLGFYLRFLTFSYTVIMQVFVCFLSYIFAGTFSFSKHIFDSSLSQFSSISEHLFDIQILTNWYSVSRHTGFTVSCARPPLLWGHLWRLEGKWDGKLKCNTITR